MAVSPLVSICILTYNHAGFIEEAIQSAISQLVDFSVEIIVADDCSTDATLQVSLEFAELYPNIIRIKSQPRNVGVNKNARDALQMCRGEYIALLEGDDYWIDSSKLSKQVNLLQSNPSLSTACHAVNAFLQAKNAMTDASCAGYLSTSDVECKLWSASDWPRLRPATGSIVFRRNVLDVLLGSELSGVNICDAVILFLCHRFGDIAYLPDVMGVYRIHAGGVWSGATKESHYLYTLETVRSLIQHQIYRDKAVLKWLKQLFDYNAIKIAGLCSSPEGFQSLSGIDWDESLDTCSSNPWGLRVACEDLISSNHRVSQLRTSHSFKIGNLLVSMVKAPMSALKSLL